MKKLKYKIIFSIVRIVNAFFDEKPSNENDAKSILKLININPDTNHQMETMLLLNQYFEADLKEKANSAKGQSDMINNYLNKSQN